MKQNKPALVVHGHFYQPPRENPWTEKGELQPDAFPCHDWNEQVYSECYRPNAWARVWDDKGRLEEIVNNYALMSFNFGPTLMSWLSRRHPDAYARILEADLQSARVRGGHGNAIAQAYSHPILTLCNARDLRTQVRWGLADFRRRFQRNPEALWLPETACNPETLDVLIDEGMRFVLLAPSQAARTRPIGTLDWTDVRNGEINSRVPYACFHRDGSGRSIALFFYDGSASRAIAFEGLLQSSKALIDRFAVSGVRDDEIAHVATDGETYGHHFRLGDRCLAHALSSEAVEQGFWITNYGEYLDHHPPTREVEIKDGLFGQGTSWSCAHGVGRWCRDCGCETGGRPGWNQAWRGPLRKALDYLRDEAARSFEATRDAFFRDPWEARDAYIELVLDRTLSRERFLDRHAPRALSRPEQERALTFLEIQHHCLLMYTSCGWFFSDLSGIETIQILRYAGQVIDLMEEIGLGPLWGPFLDILSEAKSNLPEMGTGADIYRRFVEPARVSSVRAAAHLSIAHLMGTREESGECAGYAFREQDSRKEQSGRFSMATGRLVLESIATGKRLDYATLAIHLGEVDFYCAVTPYPGDARFAEATDRVLKSFPTASLSALLKIAHEEFGLGEHGLKDVFPETRRRIIGDLFGSLTRRLSDQYALMYEDNQRTIEMMHSSGIDLPAELRAIAEFTLGRQFDEEIRRHAPSPDPSAYHKARAIASEVMRRGYSIDQSYANLLFTDLIGEAVDLAVAEPVPQRLRAALALVELTRTLGLKPSLDRAQESIHRGLRDHPSLGTALLELALCLGFSPRLIESGSAAAKRTLVTVGA